MWWSVLLPTFRVTEEAKDYTCNPSTTRGKWLPPPLFLRNNFFPMRNSQIHFREPIKRSFFAYFDEKIVNKGILSSKVICGIPKGPGKVVTTPSISACRWDRNEITKATPVFSESSNSTEVVWMLCDINGKLEIQPSSRHLGFPADFRFMSHCIQTVLSILSWPNDTP
jgi:hypothetical protein